MDDIPDTDPAVVYLNWCVQALIPSLGPMANPYWRTEVYRHTKYNIAQFKLLRCVAISIAPGDQDGIDAAENIIRIAFKRVCGFRKNAMRAPWVYDIVAERAVQRLLAAAETAEFARAPVYKIASRLSQRWKDARGWLGRMEPGRELLRSNDRLNNSVSSARYAAAVWLVCDRLEMIVGWQALCQLATAKSWREWVSSLPAAQRQLVATEIPTGGTDGVRE